MSTGRVIYETLCPEGARRDGMAAHQAGEVTRLARQASSNEPPAGILDTLEQARERRDSARIVVARHVAFCTAGCRRAPAAQQAPAFAGAAWDRAPHKLLPDLPEVATLAAMIHDGQTVEALADIYGRAVDTVRSRLQQAGYSSTTGRPVPQGPRRQPTVSPLPLTWPTWMLDANCASTDPEVFFPNKGGSTRDARGVCSRCTVTAECLEFAVANGDRHGIYGGVSERSRRKLTPKQAAS